MHTKKKKKDLPKCCKEIYMVIVYTYIQAFFFRDSSSHETLFGSVLGLFVCHWVHIQKEKKNLPKSSEENFMVYRLTYIQTFCFKVSWRKKNEILFVSVIYLSASHWVRPQNYLSQRLQILGIYSWKPRVTRKTTTIWIYIYILF